MKALLEVIKLNNYADVMTASTAGGACGDATVGGDCSTDGF